MLILQVLPFIDHDHIMTINSMGKVKRKTSIKWINFIIENLL